MDAIVGKVDKLNGEVLISGSKNAALPIIIGSLLIKGRVKLSRVPKITDIENVVKIIKKLKIPIEFSNNEIIINNNKKLKKNLLLKEMELLRGTSYFWGVILNNKKKMKSYIPGGCKIGSRPFDLHFDFLKEFGFKTKVKKDKIYFKKVKRKRITEITFKKESLGATINLILYSVTNKNNIKIINPSLEPEVLDLINFLNKANANIQIVNKEIIIKGVKKLTSVEYEIMYDRIEAGSYLLLATCFKGSNIQVKNVNRIYLEKVLQVIEELGCQVEINDNSINVIREEDLNEIEVTADVYPGFPTDLQQILTIALLNKGGKVKDLIFPSRTSHTNELKKLNANIQIKENTMIINRSKLINNTLSGIDLRGTFSLIAASGFTDELTIIKNIDNLLRGYEDIEYKLKGVNFPIQIVK